MHSEHYSQYHFLLTENKILPSDIKNFDDSRVCQRAMKTFASFLTASRDPTEAEFTIMRNFLLINILIDNAQRAGTLVNLKLRHVRHAEVSGEDHILVVSYY